MDLFTPVYLSPLFSASAIVLTLVAVALVITTAVLASKHRGHGIWRHR